MMHRYFTEQAARLLVGMRVQARVPIIRFGRFKALLIRAGCRGTVTQFAVGPSRDESLVGVHWDDTRPAIPRLDPYPIDWYTEEEYRTLLGALVERAA